MSRAGPGAPADAPRPHAAPPRKTALVHYLGRVPRYLAARTRVGPPPGPLSLTVAVTWRCNCRCATCRVHERSADELGVGDYERVFRSLGGPLAWATITGGEPSLRDDLPELAAALGRHAGPRVITLATNGTLPERVVDQVDRIAATFAGTLVVNLSLDGLGEQHDQLRGLPGAWDAAQRTLQGLKALKRRHRRLVVGIHTVISRHNVAAFPAICDGLLALEPDSYLTEIAQQRAELLTETLAVGPPLDGYRRALRHLQGRLAARRPGGTARLVQALRSEYYRSVLAQLRDHQPVGRCQAGLLSAQLSPDGKLWDCCVRGRELGDLRASGYDFQKVWRSRQAQAVRHQIRVDRCGCLLANAAYTNTLTSAPGLLRVGLALLRPPGRRHRR